MRLLAMESNCVALYALGAEHHAQRQPHAFEDRSLLNMQLQVGRGVGPLHARIPDPLHVDMALAQSIFQADAVAVCSAAIGLYGVGPGKCGGTEEAAAEARALLVGPIHQANGDRRFAVVVLCQAAQHLETGEDPEAAVQPSAVGDGVQMAAEDEGAIGFAAQRRPGVSRGIQVVLHRQLGQLALKPGARLEPGFAPGDALRPVIVRGERAKLSRSEMVLRGSSGIRIPRIACARQAIPWGMQLPVNPPVLPMLAKRVGELPAGDTWVFEPKWDGFRALVFRDGDDILIQSRDQKSLNRYFPELVETLRTRLPERCVLDGEIVIATESGLDFDLLQLRIHPAASRVKLLSQQTPASIVFFDLLCEGDRNLCGEPFQERRKQLERVLGAAAPPIHITPATNEASVASDWFRRFEGAGLDGVIAKQMSGTYEPDKRVMLKIKHERDCDCVVAGFRWHKTGEGNVGSLLLGLVR